MADSSSTSSEAKNPNILDGKFFKVIAEEDKHVKAICQSCQKTISGSRSATSNFRTHLKRIHPLVLVEYDEHVRRDPNQKKRQCTAGPEPALKQTRLVLATVPSAPVVTQTKFDSLLTDLIVKGMLPLTFVEQPEFVAFVKGTCPATINVMSRRTLGRRVDSDYDAHLERVRAALKMPLYVCLTADVWSTSTKSYLGVTAHWISEATLERQSAALACRRFAGTHSYDRVAELLSDVCTDYCLPTGKITGTVTDNATNFVKAFKEFGVTAFEEACAADSEDFELVTFEEIEPPGPLLSQHLRCACHTLSLIATADVKKAISANHALNRLHSSVMSKCSKYWGASGRPKSAEVVTSILGKQLPAPCITRWNSLHHALDVLTQNKEKLQDLSNELQLPSLKSSEIEFIEEYCTILKPIATGR
ncbi:uncharacterized protein ISCGN_013035 [Ixodes scapularis]